MYIQYILVQRDRAQVGWVVISREGQSQFFDSQLETTYIHTYIVQLCFFIAFDRCNHGNSLGLRILALIC